MVEAVWRRCAGRYFTGQAPALASPARTVVAVGVEGRVNVNQIHTGIGQLGELFQIVAAINDAGVEEGRGTGGLRSAGLLTRSGPDLPGAWGFTSGVGSFGRAAARRAALRRRGLSGGFLGHARRLKQRLRPVNPRSGGVIQS